MRITSHGNIQKNITMTPGLFYSLLEQAHKAHLEFQDYIRLLLSAAIRDDTQLVDEETEKRLAQAADDLKSGRYTIVSTKKELDDLLKSV